MTYINNIVYKVKRYINYLIMYNQFKTVSDKRFTLNWNDRYPCLNDKTTNTSFDRHYVYHTGWAARTIAHINPEKHIDIGSSLYFVSITSAFTKIEHYDYRPPNIILDNLYTGSIDLCNISFNDNSIDSLSCMHVIEHIGLGRYGDPIDPKGDIKAANELTRVVKNGGSLLIVVPIGKPKICFNAHRIYSYDQIINMFNGFKLNEYSLIPDDKTQGILLNPDKHISNNQSYACGCFWFIKK